MILPRFIPLGRKDGKEGSRGCVSHLRPSRRRNQRRKDRKTNPLAGDEKGKTLKVMKGGDW